MSGISRATKHIRSYYTRESQADTSENDIFRCKYCNAIVNIVNDTRKLYSHVLMHYDKLRRSKKSHRRKTDSNDPQVSASRESPATKVSSTSSQYNLERDEFLRLMLHLLLSTDSLIWRFTESGAENTESGSGEAQRKKLQSLFVIMTETIQSIKEQVNSLNDTVSSIESELNTPSDRDEQSDEIIVLKHIRKTTSEVTTSNTK